MHVRRVNGRRYSDPDLLRVIDAGTDTDPYAFVRRRAAELVAQFDSFPAQPGSPLERMKVLASLAGYSVKPMAAKHAARERRDAMLVPTGGDKERGVIVYNQSKPASRIVHSIGHEITHSFFPSSDAGAFFRSAHGVTGPPPELELLCDFGASELTMPREAFLKAVQRTGFSLGAVNELRRQFGTSFEAAAYRLASTASRRAAAGLFVYRTTKAPAATASQGALFPLVPSKNDSFRYRRQSFHHSESYPAEFLFPWNKSLPPESAAYAAGRSGELTLRVERLTARSRTPADFEVEAIVAPYQPADVDDEWPNVLVLMTAV